MEIKDVTPSTSNSASAPGTYLGQSKTGRGSSIPVNPQTGQLDINALIGQMVDRRKTYYYDTLKIPAGGTVSSTPYNFFQVPLGGQDPYNGGVPKTSLETNMRSSGMFSPPYDCIINNLGFYFLAGNRLFDIEQIVNLGWMEFKILEKTMWSGHLWRHPPGAGLTGFSTQTSEAVWNNGVPSPDKVWVFGDYKKYIPPLVNFSLTLNFFESYNTFYNSVIPAAITTILGSGIGTSLATLSDLNHGGSGIQLVAILNGLSDGPVQ